MLHIDIKINTQEEAPLSDEMKTQLLPLRERGKGCRK
jgi:hypothetical protein